jgi:nitroreductase
MNESLNSIFSRRSIRNYQDKPIADDMIQDLLEAGMAAPSAWAKDPWHFIVVRDKTMLSKIADGLPNGQMLRDAGLGIVVCGDPQKACDNQESYMLQDCSAAIENILLAANAMGLGACWLGVHPREDRMAHVSAALAIPDTITTVSVLSIGYPADTPEARTRYEEEAVHSESW